MRKASALGNNFLTTSANSYECPAGFYYKLNIYLSYDYEPILIDNDLASLPI